MKNERKEELKDEMKNRISMALKDPTLQQGFEIICKNLKELEKENAELKEELKKWKDEWQEQVQKATDEGYARTLQTMQLTKAKELLERLLITSCNSDVLNLLPNCSEVLRVRVEAEQFLREVEK